MEREPEALGWDAINATLKPIYGDQEPKHWAPILPAMLGGDDPLNGISVYVADGPPQHWHYVTYGFSELYEKESDDAENSGFGIELTFRLRRGNEKEPPAWALNFLNNLARYVFKSGAVFQRGHYLNANGPLALGEATQISAVLFEEDPQLRSIQTPNGRIQFLQVVGITLDEMHAAEAWNGSGMAGVLATDSPLLVTDLWRESILRDPEKARKIEQCTDADGSSTGVLYVGDFSWERDQAGKLRLTLKANIIENFRALLRGRTSHGRDFLVATSKRQAEIAASDNCGISMDGERLVIKLNPAVAQNLAEILRPKRGEYVSPLFPNLMTNVIPAQIVDRHGKVVQIIGE